MKAFTLASLFGFVVTILSLNGCAKENKMDNTYAGPGNSSPSVDTFYKYLALGDSYTIGQSVGEKERFPYLLSQLVKSDKVAVGELKYIAQTGWTTLALQNAIAAQEPLPTYDVVTLLIGVNDQYQGLDVTGYKKRFEELLNKAVVLAGNRPNRVFVLSIPDYSATPFVGPADKARVSQEIDLFNQVNKEITLAHKISYTDITGLSRDVANHTNLLAGDGLHYSKEEHLLWAEKLAPLVYTELK